MERSTQIQIPPAICYQSIPDAYVNMGNWGGRGGEAPDKPLFINIRTHVTDGPAGKPTGEMVDVCIALTHRQVAQIVKHFFFDVILEGEGYRKMLKRLLVKRWAIMTDSFAKDPNWDGDRYQAMRYADPREL